jgi:protein SYS1
MVPYKNNMNSTSISSMDSNTNATTTINTNNSSNGGLSVQHNIGRRINNNGSNGVVNNCGNGSSSSSSKSKKKKFYPRLIATQIVAIQCFHYFILTLLYEVNAMIFTIDMSHNNFVTKIPSSSSLSSSASLSSILAPMATTYMSLDRIFTDQYIHLYHLSSYPDILTVFVAAICTAYVFVVIVEKSKQCLDFAMTLFLCHLLLVWMYNQKFPTHIEWYIVHVIATIMMILLAEHLCAKRELDDIPLLTL